jgi:hypothetical protein
MANLPRNFQEKHTYSHIRIQTNVWKIVHIVASCALNGLKRLNKKRFTQKATVRGNTNVMFVELIFALKVF